MKSLNSSLVDADGARPSMGYGMDVGSEISVGAGKSRVNEFDEPTSLGVALSHVVPLIKGEEDLLLLFRSTGARWGFFHKPLQEQK